MQDDNQLSSQLSLLRERVDEFAKQRDWEKFHTPKNLAMALAVETAELMEIFQWTDGTESFKSLSETKQVAVRHEVADIFIYLLRFCSVTCIDPIEAAEDKIKLNAEKYPADRVRGKSDKYTDYQQE